MSPGISAGCAAALLLFFGTINSVTSKIQLLIEAKGFNGIVHKFEKPVFQSFVVFVGCLFSLPIGTKADVKAPYHLKDFKRYEFAVPSLCATCASVGLVMNIFGLNRVDLSIYQMLRGALTIFSTMFSVICLKRTFKPHQWIGLTTTVISLVIVGVSGIMKNGVNNRWKWTDKLIGIFFILLAQVVQGGQLVLDEYMTQRMGLPVMFVVGMEGLWGILICLIITNPLAMILPGNDYSALGGCFENFLDSWIMIGHSWKLQLILLGSLIAVGCYDCFGMMVTCKLSSVHRTILEALRTLTAWVAMLIIGTFSDYGERWEIWCWLELGGFVLLVFSSLLFNGLIKLPGVE